MSFLTMIQINIRQNERNSNFPRYKYVFANRVLVFHRLDDGIPRRYRKLRRSGYCCTSCRLIYAPILIVSLIYVFLLCSLTCPSAFLGLMLSAQVSPTDGIAGSIIRSEFQQIEIYKLLNIMTYYNHTKNVYL